MRRILSAVAAVLLLPLAAAGQGIQQQFPVPVPPAMGGTGLAALGTGVATALGIAVGSAGGPVTNGGALGSPSSAGTLPAYTLGGTISGGGNQINNVIIGTTTPLAGSFTTITGNGALTQSGGYAILGSFNAAATYPTAGTAVGIAYNFSNALREISFFNTDTLATSSFTFRQLTGASAQTLLLTVGTGGIVIAPTTDATSVSTGAIQNPGGMSVNKRVWMDGLTAASGTPSSICRNANEVTVNAALTCTVSSLDFKHDFKPIESCLDRLMAMEPGTFYYNDDDVRQRIGFAAEYMRDIDRKFGDAYDAGGKPRSIDQNAILGCAVKAVQELAAEVRQLRAR